MKQRQELVTNKRIRDEKAVEPYGGIQSAPEDLRVPCGWRV
jgi:hypothetical protein